MPLDFRKNANVVSHIYSFAKQKQPTAADPYVVDGYELHARPELENRLKELAKDIPEAQFEYVYGIPVLYTAAGRVFATAGGTHYLDLYLPEGHDWGKPSDGYGEPWRTGYAWATASGSPSDQELHSLLRLAYSTALAADSVVNLP